MGSSLTAARASAVTALLAGLPLAGVILAGKPAARYLEFPPVTRHVSHAPFCLPVFAGMAALILAVVLPLDLRVMRCRGGTPSRVRPPGPFPSWGWLGLGLGCASWVLAWTRFEWFSRLQVFTFSPLWFAYIMVVNAWTWRRSGHCMLRDRPGHLLRLFAWSAVFWWFFEYLNRFVQNWHYEGCGELSPIRYFVFATLPFSTVLPAVLGTEDLLATFPRTCAGLDRFVAVRLPRGKTVPLLVLVVSGAGLAAIGIFPDYLYPLLWVSPLFVLTSLQALAGKPTVFTPLAGGDWQRVYRLAMAALICGFFWEMWNYRSLARWVYSVPFVHAWQVFEMPLLGFAGYLPFGLECAVIADLLTARRPGT